MSTSSNQWYVEMSAGITLGPMPFSAVVELAETSAIMRDDRVREGSSTEWKSAHQVPGLFTDEEKSGTSSGVASLSVFELTRHADKSTTDKHVKSDEPTTASAASDGVIRLDSFEVLLGESETTSADDVDDPASALLRAAASLKTAEPLPTHPGKPKPKTKVDGGQGGTSQPICKLEISDDVIPDSDIPASEQLNVPSLEPALSRTLDVPESSRIYTEPEVDIRNARPQLDLSALVSVDVKDEAAPTNRLKLLTVQGGLALAAVVGAWLFFSLLTPDMEVATYYQYASIYQEYQTFAELPDSGSWSQFATRAKSELDESLPELEAVSVPGERSKSLLLYAGRDLRTALDLNPGVANPHAERLAGFFEQLNEQHASGE